MSDVDFLATSDSQALRDLLVGENQEIYHQCRRNMQAPGWMEDAPKWSAQALQALRQIGRLLGLEQSSVLAGLELEQYAKDVTALVSKYVTTDEQRKKFGAELKAIKMRVLRNERGARDDDVMVNAG